jgi:hypothetical protein
MRARLP